MLNPEDIEEIRRYFNPKPLTGKYLPNVKTVSDNQSFYLEESDGVYVEHIMFKGKWRKKVVDINSNVVLKET